jgi:hypothetical protein
MDERERWNARYAARPTLKLGAPKEHLTPSCENIWACCPEGMSLSWRWAKDRMPFSWLKTDFP